MTDEIETARASIEAAAGGGSGGAALPLDGADDLERARWPRNDYGNAKRLIARHGRDLLHIPEAGWYAWDGRRWNVDLGPIETVKFAHRTAEAIRFEASAVEEDGPSKEFKDSLPESVQEKGQEAVWSHFFDKVVKPHRTWAITSGNAGRVEAMLSQAAPYLSRRSDDLDARPRLLTVENGTLDLAISPDRPTPALLPHDRTHLITKCAAVAYDPAAKCPGWLGFLERVQPQAHMRAFLRRFMGYCMTGETSEQVLLMLTGVGANGKSVFVDTLCRVMGDHAAGVPFASLLHNDRKSGSEATPDLVKTEGARLVRASEPEQGARFSESRLKELTGGETIQIRRLHKEFHDVRVSFKMVLSFNNKPSVRDTTESIWRRILLVPWDVVIPPDERRPDLARHLYETEAAGILNWLLDGYLDWVESGLRPPEEVVAATEEYRAESDPIAAFLADGCERREGATAQAATLYQGYVIWCKRNGAEPVSSTRFGRLLSAKGIHKDKQGVIVYVGLRLRPDYDPMAQRDMENDTS